MAEATYSVTGMTCDHCVRAVEAEVAKIAGVASVSVDLSGGQVTLRSDGPVDPAEVKAAVEEAGFVLESLTPSVSGDTPRPPAPGMTG